MPDFDLVVTTPFGTYERGDVIPDDQVETVAAWHNAYVVRRDKPAAPPQEF